MILRRAVTELTAFDRGEFGGEASEEQRCHLARRGGRSPTKLRDCLLAERMYNRALVAHSHCMTGYQTNTYTVRSSILSSEKQMAGVAAMTASPNTLPTTRTSTISKVASRVRTIPIRAPRRNHPAR
jgi:hypothetical protein